MVGYGEMHKQMLRKDWESFYVDYDLLQRMLQNFIDCPGLTITSCRMCDLCRATRSQEA